MLYVMILVSACLVGLNCNFKGESRPNQFLIDLVKSGKAIPICPEQLGGLCTSRSGARIESGRGADVWDKKSRVLTDGGEDVADEYVRGGKETLDFARKMGIGVAVLKQGSPSCGNRITQGGRTKRKFFDEKGTTVALLEANGIRVLSEEDLSDPELRKLC